MITEKEFNKQNYAEFWDKHNEWRYDDLYNALSGRYKTGKIYEDKVEEYHSMDFKDMPRWLQILLEKEMDKQDMRGMMKDE